MRTLVRIVLVVMIAVSTSGCITVVGGGHLRTEYNSTQTSVEDSSVPGHHVDVREDKHYEKTSYYSWSAGPDGVEAHSLGAVEEKGARRRERLDQNPIRGNTISRTFPLF